MKTKHPSAFESSLEVVERDLKNIAGLTRGSPLLSAFSGGADSTALAILLSRLGLDVSLAHIDHRMRQDSHLDSDHCRAVAGRLGLPIEVGVVDRVPRSEAQARDLRYGILQRLAVIAETSLIATGHTHNDHIETILMRLERGGRAFGIPPRRANIIRPLLGLRRSDTEKVCREAGVGYLLDPSNEDLTITRNRIRHKVVPSLSESDLGMLRYLALVQTKAAADLREEIEASISAGRMSWNKTEAVIDLRWFRLQPAGMQQQSLRYLISASGGIQTTSELIRRLRSAAITEGLPLDLPGGWVAHRRGVNLKFERPPTPGASPPETRVNLPGITNPPGWGISIAAEWTQPPHSLDTTPDEAVLDAGSISDVVLRTRRPGDKMRPLGMNGTKKLSDIFIDRKVPQDLRAGVPVFTSDERIVWVRGVGIDDRFRITPTTKRAIRVTIFEDSQPGISRS